jgi:hypothetical protein
MISWVVVDSGIRGPRIWPEAPTEAAARTTEAATAPWRNLRREMRGALLGGGLGGWEAAGWVGVGGVEFVDVLGFFSSMDNSSVSQE